MEFPLFVLVLLGLSMFANLVSAQTFITIESTVTDAATAYITSTTIVYQTVDGGEITTTLPVVGSSTPVVTVTTVVQSTYEPAGSRTPSITTSITKPTGLVAPMSSAALPAATGNGTITEAPSSSNVGAIAGGVGGALIVVLLMALAFFCFRKGWFGKKKKAAAATATDPAADPEANQLRTISYSNYEPALDQPQQPMSTQLHAPPEAHESRMNYQIASVYDNNPAAPDHQRPCEQDENDRFEDARSVAATELSEFELIYQRVMNGPSPPPVEETPYNISLSMDGEREMDQDHRYAEGLVGDRRYHEERVEDDQYPEERTPPIPPKSPLRRLTSPADTVLTTWDGIIQDAIAPPSVPTQQASRQMPNRGPIPARNNSQQRSLTHHNDRSYMPTRSGDLSASEKNLVNHNLNRYEKKIERDLQVAKQGGVTRNESVGLESQMKSELLKDRYRRISQERRASPIPGRYTPTQQYENSPGLSTKSYVTATSQQGHQETSTSTRRISDQYQPPRGDNWKQVAQVVTSSSKDQEDPYSDIKSDILRSRLESARKASLQQQIQKGLRDSQDRPFSMVSAETGFSSYSEDNPLRNDATNRVQEGRRAEEARFQSLEMVVNSPDGLTPADFHDSEDEMPVYSDREGDSDHERELAEARRGKRVERAVQQPIREVRSEVDEIQQPQPAKGARWNLFG